MYKVILVDDEIWALKDLEGIIDWSSLGFEIVATASDAKTAIDALEKHNPDIILTDLRMPGLSGIDMLKIIRDNAYETLTIFISAYSEFEYAKKALDYDALAYILKPVNDEELTKALLKAKRILNEKMVMKNFENLHTNILQIIANRKNISSPIREIMNYIDENYSKRISIKYFSKKFHLNTSYLSDRFKKETGISFTGYITARRMQKAEELLLDVDMPLSEISKIVGYTDYFHFSKQFKKYSKISPMEYRKKMLNMEERRCLI